MQEDNTQLKLTDYFSILKRKVKLIVTLTFVLTGLVAVYSFVAPQTFVSTTTLMPPEQKSVSGISAILQNAMPSLPFNIGGATSTSLATSDVLTSNAIAERIYTDYSLAKSSVFQQKLKGEVIGLIRSSIIVENKRSGVTSITVSMSSSFLPSDNEISEIKRIVAVIANGVPSALDRIMREKSSSTAKKTRQFIEKVIHIQKRNLDSVQNELQLFQEKNKVVGIDAQTQAMVSNTADLGAELAKAELQLSLAQQEYNASSPLIVALQSQIATINEQFKRAQTGGMVNFDKTSIPVDSIPSLTKQYINLIRDQKILEQINMYLQTQRLQELIQEEKDIPSVQVLDQAFEPVERTSPKRFLMITMAAILSFLSVSGFVFMYVITTTRQKV